MPGGGRFGLRKAIVSAREHLEAGRIPEATAICNGLLRSDSHNADALQVLGLAELRSNRPAEAIRLFTRALDGSPSAVDTQTYLGDAYLQVRDLAEARRCYEAALAMNSAYAQAHNSLGIVFAEEKRVREAIACFTRAVKTNPGWPTAHFNLGLARKELHEFPAATRALRRAWTLDPLMSMAMHEFVDATAQLAREVPDFRESPVRGPQADSSSSFSVVFCSIDERKRNRTIELYRRLFAGRKYELIPIADARSLAEAYNRGIASSTGDIVILSHDDIDILADDFAGRLEDHFASVDIVGVMGAADMSGPTWNWSRHPYLRGWITHRTGEESEWLPLIVHPEPVISDLVVLDGVFIAARRGVFDKVNFDQATFDGFHLYDIDWSYRAWEEGYRMAAAGDLLIVHASRGRYDAIWAQYADRFCAKHLPDGFNAPAQLDVAEASLGSKDEVLAFFARLKSATFPSGEGE